LYSVRLSVMVLLMMFLRVFCESYFLSICLSVPCFMSACWSSDMMSVRSLAPFSECHLCWAACAFSRSRASGWAVLKCSIDEYSFWLIMSWHGTTSLLRKGV